MRFQSDIPRSPGMGLTVPQEKALEFIAVDSLATETSIAAHLKQRLATQLRGKVKRVLLSELNPENIYEHPLYVQKHSLGFHASMHPAEISAALDRCVDRIASTIIDEGDRVMLPPVLVNSLSVRVSKVGAELHSITMTQQFTFRSEDARGE